MGRRSTGLITTKGAQRIELKAIIKGGMLVEGEIVEGVIRYNNGDAVTLIVNYQNESPFMILRYRMIQTSTGKRWIDDFIYMEKRISNIGKGHIYYLICPETNRRCRTLFKCYGSPIFKSFGAYRQRIYYDSQLCSNWNDRFWHYHRKLERMDQGRGSFTYAGKITNRAKRYEAWEDKMNRADHLRFGALFSEIL